jgi:hypothetical protein
LLTAIIIDFYDSSEWEENTGKPFPVIMIICPTKATLIYAKRFAKIILDENDNPTDLHIRFATVDGLIACGVTGEIWEKIL